MNAQKPALVSTGVAAAGCGKATVAMQYVTAAAQRGQKASVFMFDELADLMCDRLKVVGHDLAPLLERGTVTLRQVDPTELSPGEFAAEVRRHVESGVRMVVIDSLNGNTIRELTIDTHGVGVGEALSGFQGILTGMPLLPEPAATGAIDR